MLRIEEPCTQLLTSLCVDVVSMLIPHPADLHDYGGDVSYAWLLRCVLCFSHVAFLISLARPLFYCSRATIIATHRHGCLSSPQDYATNASDFGGGGFASPDSKARGGYNKSPGESPKQRVCCHFRSSLRSFSWVCVLLSVSLTCIMDTPLE